MKELRKGTEKMLTLEEAKKVIGGGIFEEIIEEEVDLFPGFENPHSKKEKGKLYKK